MQRELTVEMKAVRDSFLTGFFCGAAMVAAVVVAVALWVWGLGLSQ